MGRGAMCLRGGGVEGGARRCGYGAWHSPGSSCLSTTRVSLVVRVRDSLLHHTPSRGCSEEPGL